MRASVPRNQSLSLSRTSARVRLRPSSEHNHSRSLSSVHPAAFLAALPIDLLDPARLLTRSLYEAKPYALWNVYPTPNRGNHADLVIWRDLRNQRGCDGPAWDGISG